MTAPTPWAAWLGEYDTAPYQLSRKAGWDAFVNAAPRPRFEVLSRAQMRALDEDTLADYNEARCVWNANPPTIKTQQLTRAFQVLDQVMASGRRDGDKLRGSAVVDAEPGLGKTTIATRFAREVHRREYRRHSPATADGSQRLPVAFVPLAAGVTLKGLNQQILKFYDHPAAERANNRTQLTSLAVDCVTTCQTRLVVIDDLHFIDFRHKNGIEVSNHLKSLANALPVTFLYVGVNLMDKRFFDEGMDGEQAVYAQMSRRATRCPVTPFSIDNDAGARAWSDLLTTLEGHLILADGEPGMLVTQAKELHRRTQGRIASLTNLIDRAAYLAIASGAETINPGVLDSALTDNAAHRLAGTA
ncbi:MAG: ATP-binding protein [Ornithinimicrobium sp.]|uniref:ATP-binding protein n=1 Tax=Ornithinimicrobium sp. TaxID=1977084 RepID=UPI0026DF6782|nr:ATP-binding protein [Ornithinimicrobium sp.]MDO5740616.1 ATP-binding protein [Ornithinimicrobium sp.]